jgi:molecular chaperone Hsp33
MIMQDHDQLHRFIFENTPIRGNFVHLNQTFTTALRHQDCPPILRRALGELMAASALLAATLKMQGSLVLQIQGKGALKLLVVECTAELTMRATAKWSGELPADNFGALVGDGQFVITLDPKDGRQTYQGIVPLEGSSVAEILQNYMQRSEQIETRIWLACDDNTATGMLLQKLPETAEQAAYDTDAWTRLGHLAETVQPDELLGLPAQTLLRRLFHEEDVRLFDAQPVSFHCSCSRNSVGNMLRLLGREEVDSIIAERDEIEVNCDFCNAQYRFDKVDAEQLFSEATPAPGSSNRH